MFKTVLFPLDRSREAREAAEVVANVVQKYGSRLVLLSVLEEPTEGESASPQEPMASHEAIAELLDNARSLFVKQGIEAEIMERTGKPAFTICDVADEIEANLIIMGSRGMSLIEEAADRSVANQVINLSPCPILVVP